MSDIKIKEEWLQENGKYKCPYCNKEYKLLGICSHIWKMHTDEGKQHRPSLGKPSWRKGLTKETDERLRIQGENISKSVKGENNPFYGKHHSEEVRKQISNSMKENGTGGFNSRTTIIYEKKDSNDTIVKLQSGYELIVAEDLDKNNIKWIRPRPFIWHDSNNEWHKYYPDFYLPEYNIYLDPKNKYLIERDQDKINRVQIENNIKVLILNNEQLSWQIIKTLI